MAATIGSMPPLPHPMFDGVDEETQTTAAGTDSGSPLDATTDEPGVAPQTTAPAMEDNDDRGPPPGVFPALPAGSRVQSLAARPLAAPAAAAAAAAPPAAPSLSELSLQAADRLFGTLDIPAIRSNRDLFSSDAASRYPNGQPMSKNDFLSRLVEGGGSPQLTAARAQVAPLGPEAIEKFSGRVIESLRGVAFTDETLYDKTQGGQPSISDVQQNAYGNCWFAATMASIAMQEPEIIKRDIAYDPATQTFAVTFWSPEQIRTNTSDNGPSEFFIPARPEPPVIVTQDDVRKYVTEGATAGGSRVDNNPNKTGAIWPAVLEAAYMKAHPDRFTRKGGQAPEAFSALAGRMENTHEGKTLNVDKINQALAEGRMFVMSSGKNPPQPMVAKHQYTVVGAHVDPAGRQMVDLRNPWGDKEAGEDGRLSVPLDQLRGNNFFIGDTAHQWDYLKDRQAAAA